MLSFKRFRWHHLLTAVAAVLVFAVLNVPNKLSALTPLAFVRLPLEGFLIAGFFLALPVRARPAAAAVTGTLLSFLTILKLIDMGFYETLDRAFDPATDWPLLSDAAESLRRSIGRTAALGVFAGIIVALAGFTLLLAWAMRRLARLTERRITSRVLASAVCAILGLQLVLGAPLTVSTTASHTYNKARQVYDGVLDKGDFRAENAADAFRNTPGSGLLNGLRGKDFILAFIESYGRVALDDPELAPSMDAVLDAGSVQLTKAGFSFRSAFLTSPTAGGGSWLAHSTFLSGVWIDNQQRYTSLLASDRLTLNKAFRRAGWRTACVMSAVSQPWPEGESFYGLDKLYLTQDLGYRGPRFTFDSVPDQFTLSSFHRLERTAADRGPLMAEIALMSSHGPWAPLPRSVGWDELGDGSVFTSIAEKADQATAVWSERNRIRQAYVQAVAYSVASLLSYVEKYGDDDLVLVFLGDHQPAPVVTGEGAVRDVPITIMARDQAVLDRISAWGWQEGMKPGAQAPVWPMNAFRDRFLAAFS
ncbi:sulfatase-like hydrolase/transferase [Catelliglobosispora koreensis]|uniref:sulfatase-like hydrolase/transferase n=1 Tax=Catelliglobosispora koreensis TaxID=129052 RepID=UPI0003621C2E|nr:sulfatase-like hydrolase/transferase [Catelliglobosispora koreensis]